MLVELHQADSEVLLDRFDLSDPPYPGRWVTLHGTCYLVLQRRHRYTLLSGQYKLSSIALLVKIQKPPVDAQQWNHGWVIGDPQCRFNALSPLLRCAVWPEGPCERCAHHQFR